MSEFRASMRCWLPGKEGSETPFAAAQCEAVEAGGLLKLKLDDGGGTVTVDPSKQDVLAGNETGSTAFDHCALIHMNEPCVLENSRLRYLEDEIYTLVGTIMIAINPFMEIDAIYGPEVMKRYAGKELGAVKAHLYAMGETAYRTLLRGGAKRTALVMSGESGAGKTETAKHLMQYIAWCSEGADGGPASGLAAKLANMIIASSPLLEAFGNAKTVRNNNSSRFGKMMRLHFHPSGAMAGAFIKTYLLEKIRVCAITSPERNYHVFYQLLAARPSAASSGLIAKKRPSDMRCLNKSTCVSIERVDDAKGFEEISRAMGELGVESGQQEELWRVLCGLLLLGDVDFDVDGGDKALVSGGSTETITGAEELLGCGNLAINLTSKESGRRSLGALKLNVRQAHGAREAAIKDVFVHIFDWVVRAINSSIKGADNAQTDLPYIGLLDIFGFEVFAFNSFEQLCINFTNEKLQQFFLMAVFNAEAEEHDKEGVPLSKVEYQDNQGCIELLEQPA